ncbi:flagellar assembly peptidoglycan hydrolase FlgJ [Pelagibaculum spongiae]|uniref:Peptidoglycan hydrolase FlgJ n=1 Tax=Pelagibaculum spongiae TaxID=2080658 RepID=A0A2V1GZE6_9GAMM|nr:flagellar assembly peptidoglycan hydrolase FlgJ [Pelagibaculum spongiae]PVZ66740.1 flagellar assembly peptidoglycan hydrolase FlgJ [Pelagibaculum spongiae]
MQLANENYLASDVRGLADLKRQAGRNNPEATREAARQFEGQFFKMMLKSMRESNAVFEEGNFMHSNGEKVYEQMMDDQLVDRMTRSGSLGLTDMIVDQLQRASKKVDAVAPETLNVPQRNQWLSLKQLQNKIVASPIENNSSANKSRFSQALSDAQMPATNFSDPADFVRQLMPMAKTAANKLGVKPEVLIAQAALETGWGKKMVKGVDGSGSNNLFNIKADHRWQGGRVQVSTLEFRGGVAKKEMASFRAYPNLKSSFNDYVDFISQSPRYSQAMKNTSDSKAYLSELQNAGYATDPNYAAKIQRIAEGEHFTSEVNVNLGVQG